jgi:cytochrome c oxidase subunit 1
VIRARRLVLLHFSSAFALFFLALLLGEWQMVMRSPLHAWVNIPEHYYRSVTGHGTVMAYVFPLLVAMGFGYAIVELSLKQALIGMRWAWVAFGLAVLGALMAALAVASGAASVLYTFYPPLIGSPFYYLGIVLVVVGSWIWVALMAVNLRAWRRLNVGKPVPLPMYANMAGAYLWAWTAVGAALEILFQILPVAFGFKSTIDAGLARVLFSWTLHAIVYFWLMPAYIAFYVIVPRAIGGRLYSDAMARLTFALLGSGFKYVHSVFTAMVVIPTLLTVFAARSASWPMGSSRTPC